MGAGAACLRISSPIIQENVARSECAACWWRRRTLAQLRAAGETTAPGYKFGPGEVGFGVIRQIDTRLRQDCMAAGSGVIADGDGAEKISTVLRGYLAPEAADSANQEVVRCLQWRRTGQTMDSFTVDLDFCRCRAESRTRMGSIWSYTDQHAAHRWPARRATRAFRQSRAK